MLGKKNLSQKIAKKKFWSGNFLGPKIFFGLKKKIKKMFCNKKLTKKLQQSNFYTTKKISPFGLKMAEFLKKL